MPSCDNCNILAIDPGTTHSAYVLLYGESLIEKGHIPNEELLSWLRHIDLAHGYAVVEMVASYGMPVGVTVMETVMWIGRFIEALTTNTAVKVAPKRMLRQRVKLWHCGVTSAKDSNIIRAVKDKYGEPGTKRAPGGTYGLKKDMWQAFALATAVYEGCHDFYEIDHELQRVATNRKKARSKRTR